MGATLSSIFCRPFLKTPVKILMVGQNSPGKTSILYKLKLGETVSVFPTCGYYSEVIQHKNFLFTIFDIGGGLYNQKLWFACHTSIAGLIFVIDSSNKQRIEEIKNDLWSVLYEEHVKDTIVLIFANKQDLLDAKTITELTDEFKLNDLRTHRWHIQGVSAVTGEGLYEGLDWLSNELTNKQLL